MDVRNKKVVFKDGFKLEYSKLLLAPGSRWECLPCWPLLDTRQGTGQDGWAQGAGAPHRHWLCLSPKTLSCKGKEVENVFTIRTPEDANRVVRLARGRNTVVVGAGFLGEQLWRVGWSWLVPRQCWPWEVQGASRCLRPRPRDGGGCLSDGEGPLGVRGGAGGDTVQEVPGGARRSCPHEGEPTLAPSPSEPWAPSPAPDGLSPTAHGPPALTDV